MGVRHILPREIDPGARMCRHAAAVLHQITAQIVGDIDISIAHCQMASALSKCILHL